MDLYGRHKKMIRKSFKDINNIGIPDEVKILKMEERKLGGYKIHFYIIPILEDMEIYGIVSYVASNITNKIISNKYYYHKFKYFADRHYNKLKKEHGLSEIILDADVTHMRCPKCLSKLRVLDEPKTYETLIEHVWDPNAELPKRMAYVCQKGCHTGIYGFDGSLYGGYHTPSEYQQAVNSMAFQIENWDKWDNMREYQILEDFNIMIKKVDTDERKKD